MKIAIATFISGLILGLILLSNISVLAQEELPNPGILPDNPLYSFKKFGERVRLWLTFDPEAKIRLRIRIAEMRLAELNATLARGQYRYTERLRQEYENEMNGIGNEMNRTKALGKNMTALAEHISNVTYKHIMILGKVLEKVPEQARPAVEHAINVSIRGHEQAVENILERMNKTREEVRKFNCTTDADCRYLICPQVLGNDTPLCEEGRCKCGGRWEITNRTEWRERFGEELTNETQQIQERIRERIEERIRIHRIK